MLRAARPWALLSTMLGAACGPGEILSEINRYVAWTPHIPGMDYTWLDQYRRQIPGRSGEPLRTASASSSQSASTQPLPQAAAR